MSANVYKDRLTQRGRAVAQKLLCELNITVFDEDSICALQNELDIRVASLVSAQEDGESIDLELLEIYDLITDILLDNEDDPELLNKLFLD